MSDSFAEDPKIQQIAAAYSLDAVEFANSHFSVVLNWTDMSVRHVERILSIMHDQLVLAEPSDGEVFHFAKMFGSYVGEVFRRNHGATWGMVNLFGESFPGLKANGHAGLFWPWRRAQNRLLHGPEDNMWHYYQMLIERDDDHATGTSCESRPERKSWWDRFRGK